MFVDTPGVHKPTHRMNVRMVDMALEAMREVDVLCLVVDASVKPGPGDRYHARPAQGREDADDPRAEQGRPDRQEPAAAAPRPLSQAHPFVEFVPLSAADGTNVDVLEKLFLQYLPEGEPLYPPDYLTDQTERFFVVRDRARTGAAADARRAAVLDRGRSSTSSTRATPDCIEALLHDPGRARVAEADRGREGRRDDQRDRHRRAPGTDGALRAQESTWTCTSR